MRHISFFLTTPQFIARTKTVTRRIGWKTLKVGTQLMAVEKGQGLGKGGKVKKLGPIEVTAVREECLDMMIFNRDYGERDTIAEGFPDLTPEGFVSLFCTHNRCTPATKVTRIVFRYIDAKRAA